MLVLGRKNGRYKSFQNILSSLKRIYINDISNKNSRSLYITFKRGR